MNHIAPHSLYASILEGGHCSTARFTHPGGTEPAPNKDSLDQAIGLLLRLISTLGAADPALAKALAAAASNVHTDSMGVDLNAANGDFAAAGVLDNTPARGSAEVNTPHDRLAAPPLTSGRASKANRQAAKREALLAEMQRVADQRNAGLDPDVKMDFIPAYVGESRANLYKKMGGAFPLPKKRGRGSFWLLSQVDAYREVNHG